jgi:hypothetical protein
VAGVDRGDLVGVHVDAHDVVSVTGERRRRHAADVSKTEYRNSHKVSPKIADFRFQID